MADQGLSERIGRLDPADLAWANERYAEIDFLPSPATDFIAVAHFGGTAAALGRITQVTATAGELGGVYVFPEFRGLGIATRLVNYLVQQSGLETLFCMPFERLRGLYMSAGFAHQPIDATVPEKVLGKHAWCNSHYSERVLLLSRGNELPSNKLLERTVEG
jgi:GNAT superfamily N-acetyltransferase